MIRSHEVFLDTAHILALTTSRDEWHSAARRWSEEIVRKRLPLVTTDFVLIEVANALAAVQRRAAAAQMIRAIQANPSVEIVPASRAMISDALALYENRTDKDWGLTDCTSFIVMKERKIEDALTVDRHFQQAGFRALLLEGCE